MKSHESRNLEFYLRNKYVSFGNFDFPLLNKQEIDVDAIIKHGLIGFHNIKKSETSVENKAKTVHFFIDDYKFDEVWNSPKEYLDELGQYKQVMSPDFSTYTDTPIALQIYNTFRNRWCAAYWQEHGLTVIPTVTWSNQWSFDFVFDGVRRGSIVAISTLGTADVFDAFMRGFTAMCKSIKPELVICYNKPYKEMSKFADILYVPYVKSKDRAEIIPRGDE
jgi:hypothetical protein